MTGERGCDRWVHRVAFRVQGTDCYDGLWRCEREVST